MINIDWELRAKSRRTDNKRLNKKIKELSISRDGWKTKAIKHKASFEKLNKELNTIKKKLQKIMM